MSEHYTDEDVERVADALYGQGLCRAKWQTQSAARALGATANTLVARVLREAADDLESSEPFPGDEPQWLRDRANQIEEA